MPKLPDAPRSARSCFSHPALLRPLLPRECLPCSNASPSLAAALNLAALRSPLPRDYVRCFELLPGQYQAVRAISLSILALGLTKCLMHLGATMWVESRSVACLSALTQFSIPLSNWQILPDGPGSMTTFLILATNSTRFAVRLRRHCKKLGDSNHFKVRGNVVCYRNALSTKS